MKQNPIRNIWPSVMSTEILDSIIRYGYCGKRIGKRNLVNRDFLPMPNQRKALRRLEKFYVLPGYNDVMKLLISSFLIIIMKKRSFES